VPHIGGMSTEALEDAFRATGILKDANAKLAFKGMKDGTEFSFVLVQGRRD